MDVDDDQLVEEQIEDVVIDSAAGSIKCRSLLMLQGNSDAGQKIYIETFS